MKSDDKLKKIKKSLLAVMRQQQRWLLLVGTGASVEMDTELGMPALSSHLLTSVSKNNVDWKSIAKKLKRGDDLETALTGINLTESLQSEIARRTAEFVAQKDKALRDKVLSGNKEWVVEPLLRQLMRGLSPTWPRLPIVTPNYDMLIEYACSKANIPYITGYYGNIMRQQDWSKAREQLYRLNSITIGGKRRNTITAIPCVELMKVHGSINLFRCKSDETFVENDLWTADYPANCTPMVAPPGDAKPNEALKFHGRLFGEAELAIDKANAFFVVGYGFRDEHIHQKILERVRDHECPLIVLTRGSSTELDKLSSLGKNIWVITSIPKKAKGQAGLLGTHFTNSDEELCGDFDGVTLWKSDVFTKQILGG